jgi:phage tail sheath protein FI
MPKYSTPSVYVEEVVPPLAQGLRTGIPAFLGVTHSTTSIAGAADRFAITCWAEFRQKFGNLSSKGFLSHAVHGFFQNGGMLCYVIPLESDSEISLRKALEMLESWDAFDLICAPDLMLNPAQAVQQQRLLLDHCEKQGDWFSLLDALPGSDIEAVLVQRHALNSPGGALYYPWIAVHDGPASTDGFVPACGHIAGVYARSDRQFGVHKAPANEILEAVTDLEIQINRSDQERLNPYGVNCLRLFAGRGPRVWGARTLSRSPEWRYINVRRLFLTVGRWCEQNLADVVFEPNQPILWDFIKRALKAYFNELYRSGALQGGSSGEAFYVRCNAQTNSPEIREQGKIVTEIGLAITGPSEFVVVRIIHDTSGIKITGAE